MGFNVSNATLKEIAQTLQEMRKHARTIETAADSLMPLADDDSSQILSQARTYAYGITEYMKRMYDEVAPMAFGRGNDTGRTHGAHEKVD